MTDAETAEEPPPAPDHERRYGALVAGTGAQTALHVERSAYLDVARAMHDDGFLTCVDLTAVDYLTHPGRTLPGDVRPERFEVVVGLLSHTARERVRLRVQVPEDDPVLPTLWELYPGTEVQEREVFDMFGIAFDGHPDLTRILMPEDWVGHPLRKDESSGRIPVQFKEAPDGTVGAR